VSCRRIYANSSSRLQLPELKPRKHKGSEGLFCDFYRGIELQIYQPYYHATPHSQHRLAARMTRIAYCRPSAFHAQHRAALPTHTTHVGTGHCTPHTWPGWWLPHQGMGRAALKPEKLASHTYTPYGLNGLHIRGSSGPRGAWSPSEARSSV
jgi:hypothetical protein